MDSLRPFGINAGPDNIHETAVYGLARIYAMLDKKISDYLRPYGLSPAKFNALLVIKHKGKEKGLSQIAVGRQLIVTASNMTRLLDRLDREGLIERCAQGEDRRVKLIKISRKGSDLLDEVWPGYDKKIQEFGSMLNRDELARAGKLLIAWCDRLTEVRLARRRNTNGGTHG